MDIYTSGAGNEYAYTIRDGELKIWEWTGNPRDNHDEFFTIFDGPVDDYPCGEQIERICKKHDERGDMSSDDFSYPVLGEEKIYDHQCGDM